MDKIIKEFAKLDDDLIISTAYGFAYQHDMSVTAKYDEDYYNKCKGYEGKEIAEKINAGRVDLVYRNFGIAPVLDVGVGSGEFVKNRPNTWGYDINPTAVEWLRSYGVWTDDFSQFDAFTFWDVIEHVPEPVDYFSKIRVGGYLFTSIPIFEDLNKIRLSRHYRPGEHLYYFTREGFVAWMMLHGFENIDHGLFETEAGRDSIESFAFRKIRS